MKFEDLAVMKIYISVFRVITLSGLLHGYQSFGRIEFSNFEDCNIDLWVSDCYCTGP
jgi:hypothetical protein